MVYIVAAKRANTELRMLNYNTIMNKASLPLDLSSLPALKPWHNNANSKFYQSEMMILDYDNIFFMGDLNYHIDEKISTEEVFRIVDRKDWANLRRFDQLTIERLALRVLQGFNEGELSFPPTFKYIPGTDLYERRSEKKLRAPAWCDRILWYTINKRESIRLKEYNRCTAKLSDHKPVFAIFECDFKEVNVAEERDAFLKVVGLMDKSENDSKPRIVVENKFINFEILNIGVCFLPLHSFFLFSFIQLFFYIFLWCLF